MTVATEIRIRRCEVAARPIDPLRQFDPEGFDQAQLRLAAGRELLAGSAIWHLTASATDGSPR